MRGASTDITVYVCHLQATIVQKREGLRDPLTPDPIRVTRAAPSAGEAVRPPGRPGRLLCITFGAPLFYPLELAKMRMGSLRARSVFHNFVDSADPIVPLLNHSRLAFDDYVTAVLGALGAARDDVDFVDSDALSVPRRSWWRLPVSEVFERKAAWLHEASSAFFCPAEGRDANLTFFKDQCPMVS
jgi:hypothetical protein